MTADRLRGLRPRLTGMLHRIRIGAQAAVRRGGRRREQERAQLAVLRPTARRGRHVTVDRTVDPRHRRSAPDATFHGFRQWHDRDYLAGARRFNSSLQLRMTFNLIAGWAPAVFGSSTIAKRLPSGEMS